VRDAEITALVRGCSALTGLDISGTSVTEAGLRAIRDYCRHLEYIELTQHMYPRFEYDEKFFPPDVTVVLNGV
jgi:hypothetical protein